MNQSRQKDGTNGLWTECKERGLVSALFRYPMGWESKHEEVSRPGRCDSLHAHFVCHIIQYCGSSLRRSSDEED